VRRLRGAIASIAVLLGAAVAAPPSATALPPAVGIAPSPDTVSCAGVSPAKPKSTERDAQGNAIAMTPTSDGRWVPVILVHGFTSDIDRTFAGNIDLFSDPGASVNVGRSLIGQMETVPGAAVYGFDYRDYHHRWVSDSHIGPALGLAIDCLYREYGNKVVVIAHSMGGLATQYALGKPGPNGEVRADEVSDLITFGTPFKGSTLAGDLLAGVDQAAYFSLKARTLRAMLSSCGKQFESQADSSGLFCSNLPTLVAAAYSPAAKAMVPNGGEMNTLKPIPSSVKVTPYAGDTNILLPASGLFRILGKKETVGIGDIAVGRDSAIGGYTTGGMTSCTYNMDPLRSEFEVIDAVVGSRRGTEATFGAVLPFKLNLLSGPCFHSSLMKNVSLVNGALGAVKRAIANLPASQAPPERGRPRSHTHYNASWNITGANGESTMTALRDGDRYSVSQDGAAPLTIRAVGTHLQVCDASSCNLNENATNTDYMLRSTKLDPAYALEVTISTPTRQPGNAAFGEPTICLTGSDAIIDPSNSITACYLQDTDLLVSSVTTDSTGTVVEKTDLTNLSSDVDAQAFDDLPSPSPNESCPQPADLQSTYGTGKVITWTRCFVANSWIVASGNYGPGPSAGDPIDGVSIARQSSPGLYQTVTEGSSFDAAELAASGIPKEVIDFVTDGSNWTSLNQAGADPTTTSVITPSFTGDWDADFSHLMLDPAETGSLTLKAGAGISAEFPVNYRSSSNSVTVTVSGPPTTLGDFKGSLPEGTEITFKWVEGSEGEIITGRFPDGSSDAFLCSPETEDNRCYH
jgi:triacylglycerol lipase